MLLKNTLMTTIITLGIMLIVALLVVPIIIGISQVVTLIEACLLFISVSTTANLVGRILRW